MDLLCAAIVAVGLGSLYAFTACRTLHTGDSPELAAAAAGLGVPHPPGYPLYTLVSALLVRLLPASPVAFAANLTSGIYGAVAAGLCVLVARRLGAGVLGALAAALCLGLGRSVWGQAVMAEVYTFDLMLLGALLLEALGPRPIGGLFGALLGTWLLHRLNNAIYLPAVLCLLFAARASSPEGSGPRPGRLLLGLAASILPLAYLPLASLRDPRPDIGDPQTAQTLWAVITAAPFQGLVGAVPPSVMANRLVLFVKDLPWESGLAALTSVLGTVMLSARGRPGRFALFGLWLLPAAGLGFTVSYAILDYEGYLLPSLMGLALLGGLGIHAARVWLVQHLGGLPAHGLSATLLLLAMAGGPLNAWKNDLGPQDQVERQGRDVLEATACQGLLLTSGDTLSTALEYLQSTQGLCPELQVVRVENLSPWYLGQLARRAPDHPWPKGEATGLPPARLARRLAEAFLAKGPVWLPLTLDPAELFPSGDALATLDRGLVRQVRRRGERVVVRPLALADGRRLRAQVKTLAEPPPGADLDLRSTYLQYGLALLNTAQLLWRFGETAEAKACVAAVLAMRPEVHERAMAEEVRAKMGEAMPEPRLAPRARALLHEIQKNRARQILRE